MILYKKSMLDNKKTRKHKSIKLNLDERPERPEPKYDSPRNQIKYIKGVEKVIRGSLEYKQYMSFLKENLDMNRCLILKNISNYSGKHYRIEMHHEPFTLFDIVETVISKRIALSEPIDALRVADEVMQLHYEGVVGLVPLTVTMHELVTNGRIFIPLQYVYQKYDKFFAEYEQYMSDTLLEKIKAKVTLSTQSDGIVSDVLDVEFVEVEGFPFPKVPEDWKKMLSEEAPTE